MATPLAEARRQHMMRLGLQATIAVLLVLLGGGVVFWQTAPSNDVTWTACTTAALPAAQPVAPVAGRDGRGRRADDDGAGRCARVAVRPPATGAAGRCGAASGPRTPRVPSRSPSPGDAHITVASEPRCELLVDGVPYGATPLIDLAVPAGKHTIVLLNSAASIRETKKVTLREGELWTRSFSFEGGKASEQNGLSAKMLTGKPEAAGGQAGAAGRRRGSGRAKPATPPSPTPAAPAPAAAATTPATAPRPVEGAASGGTPAPTAVASMAPDPEAEERRRARARQSAARAPRPAPSRDRPHPAQGHR